MLRPSLKQKYENQGKNKIIAFNKAKMIKEANVSSSIKHDEKLLSIHKRAP
jgi:hypothetical protein